MKKFIFTYFFFLLALLGFFSSGLVDSQDGFQYLAVARRIYHDHTFEMPTEKFRETDAFPENIHMSYSVSKDGKYFSPTGLGFTLAFMPAVIFEGLFLKTAGVPPISAFPLKSDWPVLFAASWTNSFFGALLGITIYLYLRSFNIKHKTSLLLSFLTIFATNLFPYTKHSYAHMMFVSFLTLTFYLFRKYSQSNRKILFVLSGASFGIVILSYNPTYLLSILPLAIYYVLLNKLKPNIKSLTRIGKDLMLFIIGVIPFYGLYLWYDFIRFGSAASGGYTGGIISTLVIERPANVIFEGIWGVLFSPGRSIFLYSPILILIFIFWFKLKKILTPEIVSYAIFFLIYVGLIGTLMGGKDSPAWAGESSWGPRYMLPVIPFGMILIANIYNTLGRKTRLLFFSPLIFISLWIQVIGVLLPYQIKFAGLQLDVIMNGRDFNVYEYGNEIPRYSPILKMSSTLIKRIKGIKDLTHGKYNIRLSDGFDLPFDLGWTTWRRTMPYSSVTFDNNLNNPVNSISLQFRNHQINPISVLPIKISVVTNNDNTTKNEILIPAGEEKVIELRLPTLREKGNILSIESSPSIKDQPLFMQILKVNGLPQNIKSIDFPYVSPVSQKLYGVSYKYWGGMQKEPWEIWYMHSGVYEKTFDLWWLRAYHYWDMPKKFFASLLMINIASIVFFGFRTMSKKYDV